MKSISKRLVFLAGIAGLAGCAAHSSQQAVGPVVSIAITDAGFEPPLAVIPAGQPATIEFTRKTDQTCATEVVFGPQALHRRLPLNRAVRIPVTAAAGDTVHYACGMGMYQGTLVAQ